MLNRYIYITKRNLYPQPWFLFCLVFFKSFNHRYWYGFNRKKILPGWSAYRVANRLSWQRNQYFSVSRLWHTVCLRRLVYLYIATFPSQLVISTGDTVCQKVIYRESLIKIWQNFLDMQYLAKECLIWICSKFWHSVVWIFVPMPGYLYQGTCDSMGFWTLVLMLKYFPTLSGYARGIWIYYSVN